jgi:hypothetical protein
MLLMHMNVLEGIYAKNTFWLKNKSLFKWLSCEVVTGDMCPVSWNESHMGVTAFVCWRKRVGPKCSVLVTHDFSERNAVHEITDTKDRKTTKRNVKLITAYLVNTTQRQEQSPTKYKAKLRLPKYGSQSETTISTWLWLRIASGSQA